MGKSDWCCCADAEQLSRLTKSASNANTRVLAGHDIPNAKTLYEQLSLTKSSVKLFHSESSVVEHNVKQLSTVKVNHVPGTIRLHQTVIEEAQTVWCQVISCFCKRQSFCTCFNIAKVKFSTLASVLPKQWLPLSSDATKAVRYLFLSCLLIRLGYRNTVVSIMQKTEIVTY